MPALRDTPPGDRHGTLGPVPEAVIELDVRTPWEPPEPPSRGFRQRGRWIAGAAVVAVALGVLVAAGPRSGAGLLYTLDSQVLHATTSAGRLFVARYQGTGPGPVIEARRLADGRLLWQRPAQVGQQLLDGGPHVVLLMGQDSTGPGDSDVLTALDAATGRELWSRPQTRYDGTNDSVVIVEEVPRDEPQPVVIDGEDYRSGINYAGPQEERRILGLSTSTGSPVWRVTVAQGSDLNFNWASGSPYQVGRFDVLSRAGLLTRWDARTGSVTETHQLDWSGASAVFSAAWPDGGRFDDRVAVYPDRQRGAIVFDLATGRSLFHWPGELNHGLFRCSARLFCSGDDGGMNAIDSTTGERRWHVDGHSAVFGFAGDRLMIGTFTEPGAPGLAGIVDVGSGAMVRKLSGWNVLADGDRPLLWRATDLRTALLGELDPATGLVSTFGRAEDWYGNPECSLQGSYLACVVVGGLSVWRLPNPH